MSKKVSIGVDLRAALLVQVQRLHANAADAALAWVRLGALASERPDGVTLPALIADLRAAAAGLGRVVPMFSAGYISRAEKVSRVLNGIENVQTDWLLRLLRFGPTLLYRAAVAVEDGLIPWSPADVADVLAYLEAGCPSTGERKRAARKGASEPAAQAQQPAQQAAPEPAPAVDPADAEIVRLVRDAAGSGDPLEFVKRAIAAALLANEPGLWVKW